VAVLEVLLDEVVLVVLLVLSSCIAAKSCAISSWLGPWLRCVRLLPYEDDRALLLLRFTFMIGILGLG
jgi:hypothetical protein